MARQAWNDSAGRVRVWLGWEGEARQAGLGAARPGRAEYGEARQARQGQAQLGRARLGRRGKVWRGVSETGTARQGMAFTFFQWRGTNGNTDTGRLE
jgi:hypothetical protein